MPEAPLAEQAHLARAARHLHIGTLLAEAGEEWGAVPLFYSVYHHVKAALLVDPIWWDLQRLHTKSLELMPDDRFVTRHKARRVRGAPREWGLNELVLVLYPGVAREYERLHVASNNVRYHAGLVAGALPDLTAAAAHIVAASESDGLVA